MTSSAASFEALASQLSASRLSLSSFVSSSLSSLSSLTRHPTVTSVKTRILRLVSRVRAFSRCRSAAARAAARAGDDSDGDADVDDVEAGTDAADAEAEAATFSAPVHKMGHVRDRAIISTVLDAIEAHETAIAALTVLANSSNGIDCGDRGSDSNPSDKNNNSAASSDSASGAALPRALEELLCKEITAGCDLWLGLAQRALVPDSAAALCWILYDIYQGTFR